MELFKTIKSQLDKERRNYIATDMEKDKTDFKEILLRNI